MPSDRLLARLEQEIDARAGDLGGRCDDLDSVLLAECPGSQAATAVLSMVGAEALASLLGSTEPTLANAFALMRAQAASLAAELAQCIEWAVRTFVDKSAATAVLADPDLAERWPWPPFRPGWARQRPEWAVWAVLLGDVHWGRARERGLKRRRLDAGNPQVRHGMAKEGDVRAEAGDLWENWWPREANHVAVARWSRAARNRLETDKGDAEVVLAEAKTREGAGYLFEPVVWKRGVGVVTGGGLALLHLAERRVRPAAAAWDALAFYTTDDPTWAHFALAREQAGNDEDARNALAIELLRHLRHLRAQLGADGPPPEGEDAVQERDAMLWLDASAAEFLGAVGERATRTAAKLRAKATDRWLSHTGAQGALPGVAGTDLATLFRAWLPTEQQPPPIVGALCHAVWKDVVQHTQAARPFAILRVTGQDGDDYVKVDKAAASVSWAFGGTAVTVDHDEYGAVPDLMTRLVPRSWELLPAEAMRGPHQFVLPLETHGSDPLLVAAVGAASIARKPDGSRLVTLPALVGKLTVVMLASVRDDELVTANLGDLTRELYPKAKRLQLREYARVTEALLWTKSLHLILPDDTAIQCFDVRAALHPDRAHPDQTIGWGIGRHLQDLTHRGTGLRGFRGYFVLNKSGAMRLPNKRAALLRHYVRAAAMWNDAHDPATGLFNPDSLPGYTPEQWAALTNTMGERAAEYAAAGRGERKSALRFALYKARKEIVRDLEELADEHGLIRLERRGRKGELVILPAKALLEAYDRMRKGGTRPDR